MLGSPVSLSARDGEEIEIRLQLLLLLKGKLATLKRIPSWQVNGSSRVGCYHSHIKKFTACETERGLSCQMCHGPDKTLTLRVQSMSRSSALLSLVQALLQGQGQPPAGGERSVQTWKLDSCYTNLLCSDQKWGNVNWLEIQLDQWLLQACNGPS